MPENSISVRFRIKTQKIREELEEAISSIEGFVLQRSESSQPCDLLIMEMGDDPAEEFRLVNDFQTLGIAGEVFLTSDVTDSETLLKALRTGVREFFPQPLQREEVKTALIHFKERFAEQKGQGGAGKSSSKKGKIIAVLGSKGGTGTTTVAVNLAACLAGPGGGQSIALLDIGFPFGDVSLYLGIKPLFDWTEAVRNISRLDNTYLTSILTKHSSGIYVLPSPARLSGEQEIASEDMKALLEVMRTMFDFIIVDCAQALDGAGRMVLKESDTVLMVTLLSLPCLVNVKRILSTFRDFGYPSEKDIQILANRVHKNSPVSLKEAEESVKKKFLWVFPNNYQLTMRAINQGKSLCVLDHGAEISKKFRELSSAFSGRSENDAKEGFAGSRVGKLLTKIIGESAILSSH
ncbi:MAG: AAA family ATPase [bacterium]